MPENRTEEQQARIESRQRFLQETTKGIGDKVRMISLGGIAMGWAVLTIESPYHVSQCLWFLAFIGIVICVIALIIDLIHSILNWVVGTWIPDANLEIAYIASLSTLVVKTIVASIGVVLTMVDVFWILIENY